MNEKEIEKKHKPKAKKTLSEQTKVNEMRKKNKEEITKFRACCWLALVSLFNTPNEL